MYMCSLPSDSGINHSDILIAETGKESPAHPRRLRCKPTLTSYSWTRNTDGYRAAVRWHAQMFHADMQTFHSATKLPRALSAAELHQEHHGTWAYMPRQVFIESAIFISASSQQHITVFLH